MSCINAILKVLFFLALYNHLKEPEITRKNKEIKVIFKPLDNEYQYFTYAFGPRKRKFLQSNMI